MTEDKASGDKKPAVPLDEATFARSIDELTRRSEFLDPQVRFWVINAGLDLEAMMRKWKRKDSWGELKGKKSFRFGIGINV